MGLKNKQEAPKNREFVDLNDNKVRIDGIYEADTKLFGTTKRFQWWTLKTKSPSVIGLDNFEKLGLRLVYKVPTVITTVKEPDSEKTEKIRALQKKLYVKFRKLFHRNWKIRDCKYGVEFKDKFKVFQQKGRKIPILLQEALKTVIKKVIRSGHIGRIQELGKDICVSPAVIAEKSDYTLKIALDAKELYKLIVKKKMQMPSLKDLKNGNSMKIAEDTE